MVRIPNALADCASEYADAYRDAIAWVRFPIALADCESEFAADGLTVTERLRKRPFVGSARDVVRHVVRDGVGQRWRCATVCAFRAATMSVTLTEF